MRRAAKIDRNQPEIVRALEQVGCSVQSLAAVGDGAPDLLVGARGQNVLMEVKDGERVVSQQKLRQSQIEWHAGWKGMPVYVVHTVDEALEAIKHATR